MNNDLISREALKKALELTDYNDSYDLTITERLIDNAPTVTFSKEICSACGRYIREKEGDSNDVRQK